MWIAQHVMTVALQTTAMRQVARIRTKFLEAVLRQDIAWLVLKKVLIVASSKEC